MDLSQSSELFVRAVSDQLVHTIGNQVKQQVMHDVNDKLVQIDITELINQQIKTQVDQAVGAYKWQGNPNAVAPIAENLVSSFAVTSENFLKSLATGVQSQAIDQLNSALHSLSVSEIIDQKLEIVLKQILQERTWRFPDNSIPATSVATDDLRISANNIVSGIIKKFESTGIQDKATECKLTVMDRAVVVENTLITKDLQVNGELDFKGTLAPALISHIADHTVAKIESRYSQGTFDQYTNRVFENIKNNGLSHELVKIGSEKLINNQELHKSILKSNLQKLGVLKELQVMGETLLDDTVYVSQRKLGINTLSPESVVDIWDQEIQLTAGKRSKDTAFLGSPKNQTMIIGTNGKDQLTITPDGALTVKQLRMGKVTQSSAPWQPTDNKPLGHIVWNEQPQLGQPIGWVSLGGARWARFGTITE